MVLELAFILFRQHNHASICQSNPGKANPEISKIIGEMWRTAPKETKLVWQKHADVGDRCYSKNIQLLV